MQGVSVVRQSVARARMRELKQADLAADADARGGIRSAAGRAVSEACAEVRKRLEWAPRPGVCWRYDPGQMLRCCVAAWGRITARSRGPQSGFAQAMRVSGCDHVAIWRKAEFGLIDGRCGSTRELRKNGRLVIRTFALGHG